MELVRAAAHLPATTLEVVEAVFAERVTTTAVFCASHQLTSSEPLDVGTRVELEVGTEDGVAAFVCRGVVGWVYPEDAVPPGRESGVGILVLEVVEGGERFSRMVARPGAGGRVRLPGARVLQRLRIDLKHGTGVPLAPPRGDDVAAETPPVTPLPPLRSRVDDTDSAPESEAITPAPPPSSAADETALFDRLPALADGPSADDGGVFSDDGAPGDAFADGEADLAADSGEGAFVDGPADVAADSGDGAFVDGPADVAADSGEGAFADGPADVAADSGEGAFAPHRDDGEHDDADVGAPDPAPAVELPEDLAAAGAPPPLAVDDDEHDGEGVVVGDDGDVLDDDDIAELDGEDDDVVAVLHEPTLSFIDGDLVEEDPGIDPGDRLKVLAAALGRLGGDLEGTGLDGPTLDGDSGEGPARSSLSGRSSLSPGDVDLSALEELALPGGDVIAPPLAAGPGLILDLSDVSAFPEAAPAARPFEAQSTDVDLLASLSAGDVIAVLAPGDADTGAMTLPPLADPFERASTPPSTLSLSLEGFAGVPGTRGVEAPVSADADLLDDGGWPQAGGDQDHWRSVDTELFSNRRLPEPEGWPDWSDLLDARTMGVAFSVTARGIAGLEFFAWPVRGSKRYSGVGQGESADPRRTRTAIVAMADLDDSLGEPPPDDDGDVFSAPQSAPQSADDDDDPFSARTTDPRLNVEGLVARHVRASHADVTAVFDTPELDEVGPDLALDSLRGFAVGDADVTRDEMMLPRPRPVVPTKALADPLSGTDSGEGLASSESSEEQR